MVFFTLFPLYYRVAGDSPVIRSQIEKDILSSLESNEIKKSSTFTKLSTFSLPVYPKPIKLDTTIQKIDSNPDIPKYKSQLSQYQTSYSSFPKNSQDQRYKYPIKSDLRGTSDPRSVSYPDASSVPMDNQTVDVQKLFDEGFQLSISMQSKKNSKRKNDEDLDSLVSSRSSTKYDRWNNEKEIDPKEMYKSFNFTLNSFLSSRAFEAENMLLVLFIKYPQNRKGIHQTINSLSNNGFTWSDSGKKTVWRFISEYEDDYQDHPISIDFNELSYPVIVKEFINNNQLLFNKDVRDIDIVILECERNINQVLIRKRQVDIINSFSSSNNSPSNGDIDDLDRTINFKELEESETLLSNFTTGLLALDKNLIDQMNKKQVIDRLNSLHSKSNSKNRNSTNTDFDTFLFGNEESHSQNDSFYDLESLEGDAFLKFNSVPDEYEYDANILIDDDSKSSSSKSELSETNKYEFENSFISNRVRFILHSNYF